MSWHLPESMYRWNRAASRGQDVVVSPDETLLASLRNVVREAQTAPLRPLRVHNRLMTKVLAESDQLASTEHGRAVLVRAAASDPDPWVRLAAANAVARWDKDAGVEALEALVSESGGQILRPMTMSAGLAVALEPGRSAALSLLNLNHHGPRPDRPSPDRRPSTSPVQAEHLDAAERVYGLAMNGGVAHAYEVAGGDFNSASDAFDAIGAEVAANVLREVLRLFGPPSPISELRGQAVLVAGEDVDRLLSDLDARLAGVDVMEMLETATEL